MGFKLTELTESSPSAPPPSGFVVLESSVDWLHPVQWLPLATLILAKPMMVTRQVPFLLCWDEAMLSFWAIGFLGQKVFKGKKDGPFEKEFSVSEAPIPYDNSGYSNCDSTRWTNVGGPILVGGMPIYSSSEVPISGINTEGVVNRIRQSADSPPDPDAEGSD
ncbi:hypothetical protein O181_064040 [Austropuccinia psidii MF-1]|uniref:Uncharacterized protein n=1 Tax=Austropuccinia psidii MF-1 TaxID=1389203 RepID=A0A9Q3EJT8_9BASI|nr:hypothetical protein [Austropuccinia psidii MF-1]